GGLATGSITQGATGITTGVDLVRIVSIVSGNTAVDGVINLGGVTKLMDTSFAAALTTSSGMFVDAPGAANGTGEIVHARGATQASGRAVTFGAAANVGASDIYATASGGLSTAAGSQVIATNLVQLQNVADNATPGTIDLGGYIRGAQVRVQSAA